MKRAIAALGLVAMVMACGDEGGPSTVEEDLTQAGKKLIGSYIEQGAGSFRSLVLTSDAANPNANHFFADIDTNIKCITTPCPTVQRLEGTFTAGTKTITFKSKTGNDLVKHVLGKYDYKASGDKFSLSRKGFKQSLEKVESYCSADSAQADCEAQGMESLLTCVGGWACSDKAACEWSCDGGSACEETGGTCRSSKLDVTFPADCMEEFGEGTEDAECAAFNQACCVPCPQFSPPPPDFCQDGKTKIEVQPNGCVGPWVCADPTPVSGQCIKSSNHACSTDEDCTTGGCGGELCFNPEVSSGISTCECTAPDKLACGCIAGKCTWWE